MSCVVSLDSFFIVELYYDLPSTMLTDPSLDFEADDPRRELGECVRVRVRVVHYSVHRGTKHAEYLVQSFSLGRRDSIVPLN